MEKSKPLSGAARRKRRAAAGLPPRTERERAASNKQSARRTAERAVVNAAFIAALKVDRGCADCGYNAHPVALDFDHLPGAGKLRCVSQMLSCGRATLLREIAKCEVVCSNCHRVRTWSRKQALPASTS